MDVVHDRCAGLDVHKDSVVACVRLSNGGKVIREVKTFETTTTGLLSLLAWLTEFRCTHVAMEATGIYWRPVWNILSDGPFELILANAAHIKAVPGRKTDVNDATWIADLLAHGLIRSSFVPEPVIQDLRGLLRTRKHIVGVSGRAMIEAMIGGVTDPVQLVALAHRRLKAPKEPLLEALRGRVTDHHRFLLRSSP